MKRNAFTMIELIFVIVILGILAVVAIPKLNSTRDDANVARAVTDLDTFIKDLGSYYTSQGDFNSNLSAMTDVKFDTNTGGTYKYLDSKENPCFQIDLDDNGTLTVSDLINTDSEVCKGLTTRLTSQGKFKSYSFGGISVKL